MDGAGNGTGRLSAVAPTPNGWLYFSGALTLTTSRISATTSSRSRSVNGSTSMSTSISAACRATAPSYARSRDG